MNGEPTVAWQGRCGREAVADLFSQNGDIFYSFGALRVAPVAGTLIGAD